jgi:hypothetical protein
MVSVKSRRVISSLADYYTGINNRVNTFIQFSTTYKKLLLPGK